jgi:hypothetical protein
MQVCDLNRESRIRRCRGTSLAADGTGSLSTTSLAAPLCRDEFSLANVPQHAPPHLHVPRHSRARCRYYRAPSAACNLDAGWLSVENCRRQHRCAAPERGRCSAGRAGGTFRRRLALCKRIDDESTSPSYFVPRRLAYRRLYARWLPSVQPPVRNATRAANPRLSRLEWYRWWHF